MMNYTTEQINKIIKNILGINSQALDVLKVISEGEVSNGEVFTKAGMSKFVADKCITAFLTTGLIEMRLNGVSRSYRITTDGEKILKIYEGGNL